ncbi:DUF6518 family protein [Rossellomorea vietnamensis]|uniref:DUF6518 family protein n=1 Tax=Rossellomorea vietnamensis TaxID=218284 RepID=UPI003CF007FF
MLGLLLGIIAKFADGTILGVIGNQLGFWVFISTLIITKSRTSVSAAFHTIVFFMSMLISYYIYSMILFGFFPRYYFFIWMGAAFISPIWGWIVWYSRRGGWLGAVCASLPISLLIMEGYSIYYTFSIASGFSIFAAIMLFILVPQRN